MIPPFTKPGTEIVANCDIGIGTPPAFIVRHSMREIKKGEHFHLGEWLPGECLCGYKTITLTEIDARFYISDNIIGGFAGYCPEMFDVVVKSTLPESVTKFIVAPNGDITEEFEEPKRERMPDEVA